MIPPALATRDAVQRAPERMYFERALGSQQGESSCARWRTLITIDCGASHVLVLQRTTPTTLVTGSGFDLVLGASFGCHHLCFLYHEINPGLSLYLYPSGCGATRHNEIAHDWFESFWSSSLWSPRVLHSCFVRQENMLGVC